VNLAARVEIEERRARVGVEPLEGIAAGPRSLRAGG
jgi:hypothetical protein